MKHLILIAGPSGSGKTTISDYLSTKYQIPRVITHTTRPRRDGEVDGVDYYFETEESFAKLHFFEQVEYGGYHYGSSKEALQKAWDKSDLATLIVDTKGVSTYVKQLPKESFFIYVTVSNIKEIKDRLKMRGDSADKIKQRIESAEFKRDLVLSEELEESAHYLINDDLASAKKQLTGYLTELRLQSR